MPVLSGPAESLFSVDTVTPFYVVTDGDRTVIVWEGSYYSENLPDGARDIRDGIMEAFGHRLSNMPDGGTNAVDVMKALCYNMPYTLNFVDHEDGEPGGFPKTFEEGVRQAQEFMALDGELFGWEPDHYVPMEIPRFEYDENDRVIREGGE